MDRCDDFFGFPIMRHTEAHEYTGFSVRKAKQIEIDIVLKEEIDFFIMECTSADENISEADLKSKVEEFALLQRQEIVQSSVVYEFTSYSKVVFYFGKIRLTEIKDGHHHIEIVKTCYDVSDESVAILQGDNYFQICLGEK